MGNVFLYPAPSASYTRSNSDPTLIYVPQKIERNFCGALFCAPSRKETTKIPCRYIECQYRLSPYLIVFFHGNSEDIGEYLSAFLSQLSRRFGMNVLCPEYPSYGIYKKIDDSLSMDEAMMEDARQVLKYCQNKLNYKLENIILVGRSLGTGVIAQLASEYKVRGSVLISPYTAIREVATNLVGGLLSKVIPDVFRSIDYVDKIQSPILYIHGEEDALIPSDMSMELYHRTKAPKMIKINEEMTHNQFRLEIDIFTPIQTFMVEKLSLKDYLYSKREKTMDSYGFREPTESSEFYGAGFNNHFDTGLANHSQRDRPLV